MSKVTLQSLYGLAFHPFRAEIPEHALWKTARVNHFITRLEKMLGYGGFALLSGQTGLGKSKVIQCIASTFSRKDGVNVGIMERPQSTMMDFYRELGEVFGLSLAPANRYGSFRSLRQKWATHCEQTLYHPLLLIDEAQEMPTECLTELRLLSSEQFDSKNLLTIVLCGDSRLPDRFRELALMPLGSRIRVRLQLTLYSRDELLDFINHQLTVAGAPSLMTDGLKETVVDHAGGNLRVLTNMITDLLEEAMNRDLGQLDEKLYIELFAGNSVRKTVKHSTPQKRI